MHFPDKIQKAFILARIDRPYFARILSLFAPGGELNYKLEGLQIPIASDSDWNLYWNLETLEKLSVKEVAGLVLHEIEHHRLEHFERVQNLMQKEKQQLDQQSTEPHEDMRLYNLAADLEINDHVITNLDKSCLPQQAPKPEHFNLPSNHTLEYYYHHLKNSSNEQNQQQRDAQHGCGSVTLRQGKKTYRITDTVEQEVWEHVAKEILHREDLSGRSADSLYSWARTLISKIKSKTKISWRLYLKNFIHASMKDRLGVRISDYYYLDHARWIGHGKRIWIPDIKAKQDLNIGVIVDVSGSISQELLQMFIGELQDICFTLRTNVIVTFCNTQASKPKKYAARELDKIVLPLRGGGTNLVVGINLIDGLPSVQNIVVFTDGLTPWPSHPTKKPMLIVTNNCGVEYPTWADTVLIEAD
ncbi:MAG: hypothetical protein KatS3mg087_1334 [Patescibacteria group bacterium]|nr:MAG: hypothetical protein KatS3mg087_1334 [Patescibacteria group bacterium]